MHSMDCEPHRRVPTTLPTVAVAPAADIDASPPYGEECHKETLTREYGLRDSL
jgi:hypothetical protein